MLKIVTIGVPVGVLLSAALVAAVYRPVSAARAQWTQSDFYRAYDGDVDAQRRVADCYKSGCAYAVADPVYECAWRDVIVKEQGEAATKLDEQSEIRSCKKIEKWDRQFVDLALKDIHREIERVNLQAN